MAERTSLIVVMPSYDITGILEKTCNDLPKELMDKVTPVDDVSKNEKQVGYCRGTGIPISAKVPIPLLSSGRMR
jgi:hypothetical protein